MKWWSNNIVLAGRDEEAGGTWLGVSKEGKFGAITNLKEETDIKYSNSRGSWQRNF